MIPLEINALQNDCEITLACRQLRTRDLTNCTIHLASGTDPIGPTKKGVDLLRGVSTRGSRTRAARL